MFWKDQIESADADTLTDVICSTLKDVNLDLANMTGLSSDGAAVMLGGVARKVKGQKPTAVSDSLCVSSASFSLRRFK